LVLPLVCGLARIVYGLVTPWPKTLYHCARSLTNGDSDGGYAYHIGPCISRMGEMMLGKSVRRLRCPSCQRFFTQEEKARCKVTTEVRHSVARTGTASIFRIPSREAWEDWTERTYSVYRVDLECASCGHLWHETKAVLEGISRSRKQIPPDEFHISG